MKAKLLYTEGVFGPGEEVLPFVPRYKEGEIWEVLENDFEKYDYKLQHPDGRVMYFYSDEVEIIKEEKP